MRKWVIGTLIVVILATAIGVNIYSAPANRLTRQLNLGQKYLAELDYEQAVAAFTKAIEIEPMSVEAYLGLADAYIGLGDTEKALEVLESGYERTQDERILEKIKQIREGVVEEETEIKSDEEKAETENNDNYIELDFTAENFNFMGYSVLDGDRFEDIVNENGLGVVYEGDIGGYDWIDDEVYGEIEQNNEKLIFIKGNSANDIDSVACYYVLEQGNISIDINADMKSPKEYVSSLFYPDDNIELVKEILKIEEIKEKGEEIDNNYFEFESNLGKGLYREFNATCDDIEYPAMYISFADWFIEVYYIPENNLILDISIAQIKDSI